MPNSEYRRKASFFLERKMPRSMRYTAPAMADLLALLPKRNHPYRTLHASVPRDHTDQLDLPAHAFDNHPNTLTHIVRDHQNQAAIINQAIDNSASAVILVAAVLTARILLHDVTS
jgi:hypothetical protein